MREVLRKLVEERLLVRGDRREGDGAGSVGEELAVLKGFLRDFQEREIFYRIFEF